MKCLPDDSIMTYHSYESLLVNHKNLSMNKRKFFFFVHSLALCWFIKQLICAIVVFSLSTQLTFVLIFLKVIHFTEVLYTCCCCCSLAHFSYLSLLITAKKSKCSQSSIYRNHVYCFPAFNGNLMYCKGVVSVIIVS